MACNLVLTVAHQPIFFPTTRYAPAAHPFACDARSLSLTTPAAATQPESERLDLQYEILKVLFGMRNHFAPLQDPKKILDIGTGTGKWAIEIGTHWALCGLGLMHLADYVKGPSIRTLTYEKALSRG